LSRPLFDHLTVDLPAGASRRLLLRSVVTGALGMAAVGLGVREGVAQRADAADRDVLDRSARRGRRRPADRPKLRGFNVRSTHLVTEAATAGCNNPAGPSGGICTTTFGGDGNASHLGRVTYASSFTSDWSKAVDTGPEGFCAPVTGTVTLRSTSKHKDKRGSVELQVRGTVCETVGDGDSYPLVLDGVYKIVDGTGKYATAKGNGQVEGSVEGAGAGAPATFVAKGTILV
jgi:hypothetical protein